MPASHVNTTHDVKSFGDAHIAFQNASQAQQKANAIKLCNNTYLSAQRDGDTLTGYTLVFHGSKIIQYSANGSLTLSSGGYRTATTKHRMNQFAPVSVSQRVGSWYVKTWTDEVVFFDGMRFDYRQGLGYVLANG